MYACGLRTSEAATLEVTAVDGVNGLVRVTTAARSAATIATISGLSIDAAISNEVLRVLKPLGIEAALKAIETQSSTTTAAERQLELSLQQARYEAAHARRQYDAVDPANRLGPVDGFSRV